MRINISLSKGGDQLVKDKTVPAEIGGYISTWLRTHFGNSLRRIRHHQSAVYHHSFTEIHDTDEKASHKTIGKAVCITLLGRRTEISLLYLENSSVSKLELFVS